MARNIITGIDVGTYHVKVVIASTREKTERGLPKIIGVGIADTRGVRHGYVTNVRDVSESIKAAVSIAEEKTGLKVKKAFVGVGGIGLSAPCASAFATPASVRYQSIGMSSLPG
jgi:cell division protein FtsA